MPRRVFSENDSRFTICQDLHGGAEEMSHAPPLPAIGDPPLPEKSPVLDDLENNGHS